MANKNLIRLKDGKGKLVSIDYAKYCLITIENRCEDLIFCSPTIFNESGLIHLNGSVYTQPKDEIYPEEKT